MIFTIVSFLIAVAGFALQVKDSFKGNSALRDRIVNILIGVFIGSLISLVSNVTVSLGEEVMIRHIFLIVGTFIFAFIVVVNVVGLFLSKDDEKSFFMWLLTALVTAALIFTTVSGVNGKREARDPHTAGEYSMLSDYRKEKGNLKQALEYSILARKNIDTDDPRLPEIDARISTLYSELYPEGNVQLITGFGIVNEHYPNPRPKEETKVEPDGSGQ